MLLMMFFDDDNDYDVDNDDDDDYDDDDDDGDGDGDGDGDDEHAYHQERCGKHMMLIFLIPQSGSNRCKDMLGTGFQVVQNIDFLVIARIF